MKPAFPLQKNTPSTYLYRSYEAVSPDNFLARCGKAKVIAWPMNFTLIFTLTKRIQQLASRLCSLQLTAPSSSLPAPDTQMKCLRPPFD